MSRSITVLDAWNQRGWSSVDHMMDHTKIIGMIGRQYKTIQGMMRAADRRAASFPTVEYIGPDGARYRYDGSPRSIPGRHVQVITRLDRVS